MDEGGQESTSVSVQATAKHSKGNKNGPALPVFNADASKVTIKGMGIKKAFVGKQNSFSVNASDAGVFYRYAFCCCCYLNVLKNKMLPCYALIFMSSVIVSRSQHIVCGLVQSKRTM